MKTNYFIITLSLCSLLSGCSSVYNTFSFKELNQVDLGMSKDEVTNILGEKYKLTYKAINSKGNLIEEITYTLYTTEEYHFRLENNTLIEIRRDFQPKTVSVTTTKDNTTTTTTTQPPVITVETTEKSIHTDAHDHSKYHFPDGYDPHDHSRFHRP